MAAKMRRILEIQPGQSWLVVSEGRWAFDAPPHHSVVPLARAVTWLLPLVERLREAVEAEAHARLGPDDPDLDQPLHAVIETGLTAWSDHWISCTLRWMTVEEIELFADHLHKVATTPTAATQRTQHAAKRLLKERGLWTLPQH